MPKSQSTYRKYHSTEMAVTRVYNDLLLAAEGTLKTRDWKTRDQNAGVENAGLENAGPPNGAGKRRTGKRETT